MLTNLLKSKPVRYISELATFLTILGSTGCRWDMAKLEERYEPVHVPEFYGLSKCLLWELDNDGDVDAVTSKEHDLFAYSSSQDLSKLKRMFKIGGKVFEMSDSLTVLLTDTYNEGKGFERSAIEASVSFRDEANKK